MDVFATLITRRPLLRQRACALLAIALTTSACSGTDTASPQGVSIDWLTIGLAGNAGDSTITNDGSSGYGAVGYTFEIGRYEVTNEQYAAYLNAVAASDSLEAYHPNMGLESEQGGISRSGEPGSYRYSLIEGRERKPANWVTFYDALRFANWMHNGQPSGEQGPATTEDGAYTITQQGIDENTIRRNPGARIAITNEHEWTKAAYHNAIGLLATDYFDYPTGTDSLPGCVFPPTDSPNSANCDDVVDQSLEVGLTRCRQLHGVTEPMGDVRPGRQCV